MFSDSVVLVTGTLSPTGVAVPLTGGGILRQLDDGGYGMKALVPPTAMVGRSTTRSYTVKTDRITGLLFGGPVLVDNNANTRTQR